MIEIRFSKTNSNTYQIQTDKEIERYYRPWLRSYNFKNISFIFKLATLLFKLFKADTSGSKR